MLEIIVFVQTSLIALYILKRTRLDGLPYFGMLAILELACIGATILSYPVILLIWN